MSYKQVFFFSQSQPGSKEEKSKEKEGKTEKQEKSDRKKEKQMQQQQQDEVIFDKILMIYTELAITGSHYVACKFENSCYCDVM